RYWDRTDFFSPQFVTTETGRTFGRIYSFRDVVGLRVIAVLRNDHEVPLQRLRRVGAYLKQHHSSPWSSMRLYVSGRDVAFKNRRTDRIERARVGGQEVLEITFEPVAERVRERIEKLRQRQPEELGQVTRNRYVVHNAAVIAGTRIPVSAIRNLSDAGYD